VPPTEILRAKKRKTHQNYKRLQQKKRSEKAENVSGSWDPTTGDCKFIKNEIARLAKEKMAKGCISSIDSRKKRATDLSGWKYKDSLVKVNPSISTAHLRSNILEPLPRKKLSLNTPGEFCLP
jgi:hypothetical protein